MYLDANEEVFEVIELFGQYKVLFTNSRIKRDSVPEGLYVYDIRHDDECQGIMCEIKPYILVNHWGTIICKSPIDMIVGNCRLIDEEEDCNYLNIAMTLKEFMEN